MKKIYFLWSLLGLLTINIGWAQNNITGTVNDETGAPLPGATVIVEGTTRGVATDFDGNFSIQASQGEVLVITYVGYTEQRVTIDSQDNYVINLTLDNNLDEIVVTGVAQGTATKKLGFKVEKVNVQGVSNIPTPDVASALIGKVAGAQIIRGTGNPLRNTAIVLRGASTIEGNSDPLIIIDGLITEGGLNDINMEDVESFEVVKGAAASSLYGSLAGNGVIQIITKKGKTEKPQIIFKTEIGESTVANKYPSSILHDRLLTSNGEFDTSSGGIVQDPDGIHDNVWPDPIQNNIDKFVKGQLYYQTNLSISQKINKVNYFASVQQSHVTGVIDGIDPYIRQNARLNMGVQVTDKLKLEFSSNLIRTKGNEIQQAGQGDNLFFNFLTADPTVNLEELDENGDFLPFFNGNGYINEYQNPLYVARNQENQRNDNRFIGGITAKFTLSDELLIQGSLSTDVNRFRYFQLFPKGYISGTQTNNTTDNGFIFIRNSVTSRVNSSVQINYNTSFEDFNFRSSFRFLHEDDNFNREDSSGSNFLTQGVESLQQATENVNINSFKSQERTQNFFLTGDIDWQDKLIIGGLIRTDRSSLFGENNRDQVFFRGSFAYRLGLDIQEDWINEFKIRASYGTAGLRPDFGDIFETFDVTEASVSPDQIGNPNLQSPIIKELELGIDFNFLNKYQFSFTYADSNTENALITVPLSGAIPGSTQVQNIGSTKYTSYELAFSGKPITKNNFSWSFGFTGSSTRNEYVSLGNIAPFNRIFDGNLFDSAPALNVFRVESGQPYGAMFGNSLVKSLDDLSVQNGIVLNEGLNLPLSAFSLNEFGHVIVTANEGESGLVNAGGEQAIRKWNPETNQLAVDRIGDTAPDLILGLSNTLVYKSLTFYALVDAQLGSEVYNYTKQLLYFNDRHRDLDDFGRKGQPSSYANASSTIYNGASPIDYFVEDASFLKVREISLSYTFDKSNTSENFPFDQLKLNFSGRNLFTFTDYSGWDPEVTIEESPIFKFDEFSYPNFRTFAASIQINF